MAIPKFYKSGDNWFYCDGYTDKLKRVPSGSYRDEVDNDGKVQIYGANDWFKLFHNHVNVTDIQRSETASDNYTSVEDFYEKTSDFFVNALLDEGIGDEVNVLSSATLPNASAWNYAVKQITLTRGKWLVYGSLNISSASDVVEMCTSSIVDNSGNMWFNDSVVLPLAGSGINGMSKPWTYNVENETIVYLHCYNRGDAVTINCVAGLRAVKISSYKA